MDHASALMIGYGLTAAGLVIELALLGLRRRSAWQRLAEGDADRESDSGSGR